MLDIDIGRHVKQENEAVRVSSSLRVERVQPTLREHSSSPRRRGLPQSELCPRALPHLCQPTMNPSARSHTYRAPARATRRLRGAPMALQRCLSQPQEFPVLKVGGTPHIPNYPSSPLPTSLPPQAPPRLPHTTGPRTMPQKRRRACTPGAASNSNHGNSTFSA